jgi:hypothetical protein
MNWNNAKLNEMEKQIHASIFMPLYESIPANKKQIYLNQIGHNSISNFRRRVNIPEKWYDMLKLFTFDLSNKSNNYVGLPVDFDFFQVHQFYIELSILLNTPMDFRLLSQVQREKLIAEKLRLQELLNNN